MNTKPIADKYNARIRSILGDMRKDLIQQGFKVTQVWFDEGDDYRWFFLANPRIDPSQAEDNQTVDLSIRISESEAFEGTDEGINFSFSAVECGGRIIGDFTPHNFTPQVWVSLDNEEAIEARFCEFESCDFSTVGQMISDAQKNNE